IKDEEVMALVKQMGLGEEMEKQVEEELKRQSPTVKAPEDFSGLMEEFNQREIDLTNLADISYDYTKHSEKGVSVASLSIRFKYGEENFTLRTEAVKAPAGWKMVRKPNLEGDNDYDYNTDDAMVDTAAVPIEEYD